MLSAARLARPLRMSLRAASTAAPAPPALPAGTPMYDPEEDPQLAGMGCAPLRLARALVRLTDLHDCHRPETLDGQQADAQPVRLLGLAGARQLRRARTASPDPTQRPSHLSTHSAQVPENDDIQSMWAPDVHKVKPFSAFTQLVLAFSAVGTFAGFVYFIQAPPPAVSLIFWSCPAHARGRQRPPTRPAEADWVPLRSQLKRAYPYDGLVKELSGTDETIYAVSCCLISSHGDAADGGSSQARTESENVVEE